MGYFFYYALIFGGYYFAEHPAVLGLLAVVFLLRRWIPDPYVFLRTRRHIGRLKEQIVANSANVTARRDLARIYLERRRPRRALELIDEARQRDPESSELLYLRGLALHKAGRHEEALEPLVQAVRDGERIAAARSYLVAGDCLFALKRYEEAIDAYERYALSNSSSIEGRVKLALAQRELNEPARATLAEARSTFWQVPGYARRKQLGWYLRALVHSTGL